MHIKAHHISGKRNILCDLLSHIKLEELQQDKARKHSSITFSTISPDLSDLQVHVKKLIELAHKGHTHQVYDRAWVVFNKHLDLYYKD